jgi:AcrR family transcriptional regulator
VPTLAVLGTCKTVYFAAGGAILNTGPYQFFPNKEAIAQALATRYAEQLRVLHERALALDHRMVPLAAFVDHVMDPIVAFNRDHPALMRLFGGSNVSPDLRDPLVDLHSELQERFDAGFAARLPDFNPENRRRMVAVSLQIALALLPLTLDRDRRVGDAFAQELKAALRAYWVAAMLLRCRRDDCRGPYTRGCG